MISLLANGLVIAGTGVLVVACLPLRALAKVLPEGRALRRWRLLAALNAFFVIGYVAYAAFFWSRNEDVSSLIVPSIFFFGACFVWLTWSLALNTARDLQRMPLLERQSVTDPLTGTFNRRYLEGRMEEEFARARRYSLPLALLVVDVDHFKRINDNYGHPFGDLILVEVAKVILETVRTSDIVARYGGEEFVVLCTGTGPRVAASLGERLRRAIESRDFPVPDSNEPRQRVPITASIGVAGLSDDNADVGSLLALADRALYRAKAQGRNRIILAGAESELTAT
jgi:diguanylate cyclase (GGDEF)-like protein